MKIPADNIAQSLLKPLDTEAASAALDSARLSLDQLGTPSAHGPDHSAPAVAATRDPGETMLAADVWNGTAESARRLDLSGAALIQPGDSAALDKTVDAILAALN